MINFFKPTSESIPNKAKNIVSNTVGTFKNMFRKATEVVKKINHQPAFIPYVPKVEVPKIAKEPTLIAKKIAETCAALNDTFQRVLDEEEKRERRSAYRKTLKLSDDIENAIYRTREKGISPLLQKVLVEATLKSQVQLKEYMNADFHFTENMNRKQLEMELFNRGYVRFQRGMTGYASVYNSMEKEDLANIEPDGSMWIHHSVKHTAEKTTNTDAVLHTCWDLIEDGETPILHVGRMMYLLGYETAPEKQVYLTPNSLNIRKNTLGKPVHA